MESSPEQDLVLEVMHRPRLAPAVLNEMAQIERQCYPPRMRYSRATIARFLSWRGSLLVCARKGEALAGFQISNAEIGQLITLDVHPRFQRQGIGSAILARTLEEFLRRGVPLAQCEIAVNNEASIRLHEKFGFAALGIVPQYYEDGTDALVMVLPLGKSGVI